MCVVVTIFTVLTRSAAALSQVLMTIVMTIIVQTG